MAAKTARGQVAETIAQATQKDVSEEKKRADELSKQALDSFTSVGRPNAPIRVLVYGEQKVGKTTFLAGVPGVYFLPLEEGANQYPVGQWKRLIKSHAEFLHALDVVHHSKHNYQALAIDTADRLEQYLRAHLEVQIRTAAEKIKDAPKTLATLNEDYGAGYELLRDAWQVVLDKLDRIREDRGMHVFFAAHAKTKRIKNLDGEDYEKTSPAISGSKAENLFKAWFDYTLFLKTEVFVTGDRKKNRPVYGDRRMYLTQKATHDAGCRGAALWPEWITLDERLGYADFAGTRVLIDAHKDKVVDVLRAAAEIEHARLPSERAAAFKAAYEVELIRRDYMRAQKMIEAARDEADEVEIAAGQRPEKGGAPANGAASATPTA